MSEFQLADNMRLLFAVVLWSGYAGIAGLACLWFVSVITDMLNTTK